MLMEKCIEETSRCSAFHQVLNTLWDNQYETSTMHKELSMAEMNDKDLGITCLGCSVPMDVIAKGEYEFEAICPSCGSRTGFKFTGSSAYELAEMGRHELTRLMNEDLAVT